MSERGREIPNQSKKRKNAVTKIVNFTFNIKKALHYLTFHHFKKLIVRLLKYLYLFFKVKRGVTSLV